MRQYRGLVRTLHKTVTVTSVSVTGLRSSRTRANKLVSIVSRFFWLVLSNLISLSRSWERKARSTLACIVPWIVHVRDESPTGAVACVASVSVWFRNKKRTRNDEELDFRSSPGEKWNESQKWKRRGGEVSFLSSPPPPRSFTRHIFRAVFWHSFLVLCSETARKRLLRRLPGPGWEEISLWIWRFCRLWFLTYYESSWGVVGAPRSYNYKLYSLCGHKGYDFFTPFGVMRCTPFLSTYKFSKLTSSNFLKKIWLREFHKRSHQFSLSWSLC